MAVIQDKGIKGSMEAIAQIAQIAGMAEYQRRKSYFASEFIKAMNSNRPEAMDMLFSKYGQTSVPTGGGLRGFIRGFAGTQMRGNPEYDAFREILPMSQALQREVRNEEYYDARQKYYDSRMKYYEAAARAKESGKLDLGKITTYLGDITTYKGLLRRQAKMDKVDVTTLSEWEDVTESERIAHKAAQMSMRETTGMIQLPGDVSKELMGISPIPSRQQTPMVSQIPAKTPKQSSAAGVLTPRGLPRSTKDILQSHVPLQRVQQAQASVKPKSTAQADTAVIRPKSKEKAKDTPETKPRKITADEVKSIQSALENVDRLGVDFIRQTFIDQYGDDRAYTQFLQQYAAR